MRVERTRLPIRCRNRVRAEAQRRGGEGGLPIRQMHKADALRSVLERYGAGRYGYSRNTRRNGCCERDGLANVNRCRTCLQGYASAARVQQQCDCGALRVRDRHIGSAVLVEVTRDNMGHSTVDVTQNIYTGTWWEQRKAAVEGIEELLWGGNKPVALQS